MAEKLITKSFERLLDKGKHRGFITFEEFCAVIHESIDRIRIFLPIAVSVSAMIPAPPVGSCPEITNIFFFLSIFNIKILY